MAISAILFLITNGWPAECVLLFYSKHCFGHHWAGQDGWFVVAFLFLCFLKSSIFYMTLLGTQTKKLPLATLFKPLKTDKYCLETVSRASLFQLSWFFPFQKAINIRWEETLQGAKAASRGLPMKEEEGEEALSSEGEPGSLAHQSFKDALFGWFQVLKDSGKLLPLTEEHWQHLTVLVIYSYLFKHFYLMSYHTTFQIFISNWSSSGFSLISLFLSLQTLGKLREAEDLKRYAACLELEGIQELEFALSGTPMSQLVDLVTAGVHRADESAPPPSRAPSPSMEDGWLSFRAGPRESPLFPLPLHWWPQRRMRWHCRSHLFPQVPLRPLLAPWKALCSWLPCRGDL